jgi:hypothetical protein
MMRGFRAHTLSQSSTRSPTPSKFSQLTPPSSPTKLSNETWAQGASEVWILKIPVDNQTKEKQ